MGGVELRPVDHDPSALQIADGKNISLKVFTKIRFDVFIGFLHVNIGFYLQKLFIYL